MAKLVIEETSDSIVGRFSIKSPNQIAKEKAKKEQEEEEKRKAAEEARRIAEEKRLEKEKAKELLRQKEEKVLNRAKAELISLLSLNIFEVLAVVMPCYFFFDAKNIIIRCIEWAPVALLFWFKILRTNQIHQCLKYVREKRRTDYYLEPYPIVQDILLGVVIAVIYIIRHYYLLGFFN